jgi:hypothetical protein
MVAVCSGRGELDGSASGGEPLSSGEFSRSAAPGGRRTRNSFAPDPIPRLSSIESSEVSSDPANNRRTCERATLCSSAAAPRSCPSVACTGTWTVASTPPGRTSESSIVSAIGVCGDID